ncbi:MAG: sigma-54 dependent transcriptional regulator, partial [Prevotellaceae bacterium]|nr:sigma-54 dependent transcriptional regulator [Prevotellaceae bacterium]
MPNRILIVEDDISFGVMLESWFKKNDFEPTLCSGMEAAKKTISKHTFNIILSDLRLPDGDGIMLLSWMKEQKYSTPLIIMTSYAEIPSAVSAIKLGAADFLEKPIIPSLLKQKIEQILGNPVLERKPETAIKPEKRNRKIVQGKSPSVVQMYEYVRLVSPTQMSVLILGESGTGKEYIARQIHESSNRRNAPFIALDCGSLSKDLAPSELFGHLKGSFTSAIADKKGAFEQANTGTIFLDEVGNLPYDVQIQLLRVLQERKIRSVGSATDIPVDVRILAATNENLETAIAEGRFREDLYHRLNEFSISVPPLRERVEDISTFVEHFLEEANQELDTSVEGITKETLSILEKYSWSGNLRELRNVIRRATLFAQKNKILPEHLPVLTSSKKATEGSNMALRNENEQ